MRNHFKNEKKIIRKKKYIEKYKKMFTEEECRDLRNELLSQQQEQLLKLSGGDNNNFNNSDPYEINSTNYVFIKWFGIKIYHIHPDLFHL